MIDINKLYGKEYYAGRMAWKPDVYPIISKAIIKFFNPNSVIDIGCGNGPLLEGFRDIEAIGIDGSVEAVNLCKKSGLNALVHDLREPITTGKKYDLAVSIEVAEHIEEEHEAIFLDNLCGCSDTIIMTASPEPDGNKYHFNVKNKEYWIKSIESRGFKYFIPVNFLQMLVKNIPPERNYLWKNLMVFGK